MTPLTATDDLAQVLAEESRLCAQLLAVTDAEEAAITTSDVERLTTLVDEKEQLLELLAALETERMTAITAIALATGRTADALTLTEVADLAAPEARSTLLVTGEELRRAGLALADANARNTRLLEASAELVERWTQYLKNVISRSLTYQQDGSAQGPQGRRVLDRTA